MNAIVDIFAQARFDTERALLGALLSYGPAAYRQAAAIVGAGDFGDAFHSRLFHAIGQGVDAGLDRIRLVQHVKAALNDDDALREIGRTIGDIIAHYLASADPLIAVEGGSRQVRHDRLHIDLKNAVEDGDTASAETIAAEMDKLSRAHLQRAEIAQDLAAVSDVVLTRINEAFMNGAPVRNWASCGSADLAYAIGGWRRGRFYVLAGRPSMGKSTVALSLLLKTAAKGHGVMFFSLEMGRDELTEMALCNIAWSPYRRIEYRDLNPASVTRDDFQAKFETILQVRPALNALPFLIDDRPGQTVAQIRAAAMDYAQRLASQGRRLDVVCIDHLNLIAPSASYRGNKAAETEEISMSLKQLAKELDIAVISLVQLNRAVEGREDKRPGLSDLRWSGAIEQDADVVMFVYREAYYLERRKHDDLAQETERTDRLRTKQNELELIVAKQRGGACPVIELYCDMGCAIVRDKARGEE